MEVKRTNRLDAEISSPHSQRAFWYDGKSLAVLDRKHNVFSTADMPGPPGAEPVPVGQNIFYYANGAFYLPEPQGLVVVAPPTGVTVGYLPSGATPVYLCGRLFNEVGGVYFEPEIQGGVTVYRVAQP